MTQINEPLQPRGPGRPKEKETEYAITHHGGMQEGSLRYTEVPPPPGGGWKPVSFAASHTGTHVLWSRTIRLGEE